MHLEIYGYINNNVTKTQWKWILNCQLLIQLNVKM